VLSFMVDPDVYARYRPSEALAAIVPSQEATAAGLRIGVPVDHFYDDLAPPVEAAVRRALTMLEEDGAELVEVRLPLAGHLAAAGSVLVMSEGFAVHERALSTSPESYGSRTRRRLVAGGAYDVRDLHHARTIAAAWRHEFEHALRSVDVIVTPTLPHTAFSFERQEQDPPDTSWGTRHANLAGTPAITLPCGMDPEGLPIGVQVLAPRFGERIAFHAARCLERVVGFVQRPTSED
jgi:aspartyl-tRNA(Asn)/glutamyl-tRNA(Gln) amidotransferase subunit A